jgi:hypothetical protein
VRRFATIVLSLSLLLGLTGVHYLFAQDEPKKEETSKSESPKPDATKDQDKDKEAAPKPEEKEKEKEKEKAKEATPKPEEKEKAKEAAPKPDASASTEAALPPIPPAVEAKLEAARRAVAEAIVAAQEAGLVKTTIDPPPILDILVTGRATDESTLKAKTGVSPEVFGAWFSGFGNAKDINPTKDVRIIRPDGGLKELYNQRASILNRHLDAVRKAQGTAKKDETPKKDEAQEKEKPAAEKPEAKPEKPEAKPEPEPKKEGAPGDDAKKDNP